MTQGTHSSPPEGGTLKGDETSLTRIKIGISSCLLGERVRFDSGHKKNGYITGILAEYFDFAPFCPEMAIGLGTPRETLRLQRIDGDVRAVGNKTPDLDVSEALREAAEKQRPAHAGLCGYLLKKDSPSCGMERVRVYGGENRPPERNGNGLYAAQLMANFPWLPVEEEGRLEDARLRENFIQRVFVLARWKRLSRDGLTLGKLQQFHAEHKLVFMSHNQNAARALGKRLANNPANGDAKDEAIRALTDTYLNEMMALLKRVATRQNHVNTLQHIQGYLKKPLDADDKCELSEVIEQYRLGQLPLIVPITLLRHHFRRHPDPYIASSLYMNPHPGELMLLNHL